VLHRLAREGHQLIATQDADRLNTRDWLWRTWCSDFGEPVARAIAAAHLCEPPLDLTVKADPRGWASRMDGTPMPWGSVRLPPGSGEVSRLPGYSDGDWWVQDSAAALPVRLFGDLRDKRVLDLCAAPGGKTAQLSQAGAAAIAVDRSQERMQQLRDNMDRLQLDVESVVADVTAWRPNEPADAVLLDAPCSATGTLRRHPDIAYLKGPREIEALKALQRRLLAAAIEMLRPGGLLVYSVCSLQREEGSEQIAMLLATAGHGLERLHVTPQDVCGQGDFINSEGDLQTLPSHLPLVGGLDGFYACRLRKH
jgi:16S rRNA (cytosine967-C5)-methyltransferase